MSHQDSVMAGFLGLMDIANSGVLQYLIFAGAILLVVAITLLWITRKPRRRKRKRKASSGLNPTLAETRDLPPLRHERPVPPDEFQS
jgi:hypothetical protein